MWWDWMTEHWIITWIVIIWWVVEKFIPLHEDKK